MKINYNDPLEAHKLLRGKIETKLKDPLNNPQKLSAYYTPGVAKVSSYLANNPSEMREYTSTNNTVAIISDGSAVLGLGDIGPEGAMPVMEGKAMLFKHFARIDAIPLVLNTKDPDEIIRVVAALAPSFGGINLEDISAPKCFYIEENLKKMLKIPVMHDDQHGTAVVVLAGLINALKVVGKDFKNLKITIVGAGAAGTAIAKLIYKYDPTSEILMLDSKGIISSARRDLNDAKKQLLKFTNKSSTSGSLEDALKNSDVFIGVSKGGLLKAEHIKSMAKNPIVFAMANPDPEILPGDAYATGAAVVATGRSDFPNQVNNALAFPGIFRGALDNQVTKITDEHKLKAALALAGIVKSPSAGEIIPKISNKKVVEKIASVIN
ncbi:NADP-dependent malic enzyme [Candidatus Saccharibacteria bacterium CPR2]|nr:NADP-dependent malic enzyme [Candidatus Saccharibacteria bacterium CPR2]